MKLLYRSEIDGLRAVAVLSVIFYHDDNHPSLKGSDLINEQIILKLNQIKKDYSIF